MSELQRVIKYCAMGFAAFLAFTIITGILTSVIAFTGVFTGIGSSGDTVNVNESFDNVKSLYVECGIGTFSIKVGDSDKVQVIAENVSEDIKVEKNFSGTLEIKSKSNFWNLFDGDDNHISGSKVTVYLPENFIAENVEINGGTGNLNIEALNTKKLDIDAGTGNIDGNNIIAREVQLNGGVGDIDLEQVDLTDVDIDCGVGNISLQGGIYGDSVIDCGVGEVDLELAGTTDDYNLKVEKGLGNVYIDGEKSSDLNWNNATAENSMDINGGVGNISIKFD